MIYVLSALGLGAACVLWYMVQRAAGRLDAPPCGQAEPDCDGCTLRDPTCPPESLPRP